MQLFLLVFRQGGLCLPQAPEVLPCSKKNGKSVHFCVVWSFLLCWLFGCLFFAVCAEACLILGCLGGGVGPAQTAKKRHEPAQTEKNKHASDPSERVRSCCLGGWACSCLCCLGGWLFFLGGVHVVSAGALFRRVRVFVFCRLGNGFCCLGGGSCVFFAVWAGGVVFFCCLGGGREFTHLPVCLARL